MKPVPRDRGTRRAFPPVRILFVQVAEDRVGPVAAAERGREKALGEGGRGNAIAFHDSSVPSSPCHNRIRPRRDERSADSPACVTVK
jgi:hypothetical protein